MQQEIEIRTIQTEYYSVNLTKDFIQIECKRHAVEEWKSFADEEINSMGNKTLEFWKKYKDFIFTAHELAFGGQL